MQLLLFRHGIAEEQTGDQPDAQRALTERGIERTSLGARGLARIIDPPQTILTSPRKRAVQTADIVGQVFDLEPQVSPVLAEGDARDIYEMVAARSEECLMLVGHEPDLSQLVELICTGDDSAGFVDLKKAGCALVEIPRHDGRHGGGVLRWLMTPHALRALA